MFTFSLGTILLQLHADQPGYFSAIPYGSEQIMGKIRIAPVVGGVIACMWLIVNPLPAAAGTVSSTGNMTVARAYQGAARLDDGDVLEVGGLQDFGVLLGSAELYDPASGTFSSTGSLLTPRGLPSTVSLKNGKVLVAGGRGGNGGDTVFQSTELYDPITGTFTSGGDMIVPRYVPVAVRLKDGRVLFAGGFNYVTGTLQSAEIYDPFTDAFSPTGDMLVPTTAANNAVLLDDGRVLIVGGSSEAGPLSMAEIYHPVTGTFSNAGTLPEPRIAPSVVLLNDGRVLVAGGDDGQSNYAATAQIWDPATESFAPTGDLHHPRSGQSAALLPGGNVLIVGGSHLGSFGDPNVPEVEIYDVNAGTFSDDGILAVPTDQPRTTVLADGRVLVAGGFAGPEGKPTMSAAVYASALSDEIFSNGFEPGPGAFTSTYDDLIEGDLGAQFDYQGIHYHDANGLSGVFPDGSTFDADELGNSFIVEDVSYIFGDYPNAGSAPNMLTFGRSFVPGGNFSIGALSQASMDLPAAAQSASVKIVFYENGPWGGIKIHLDALQAGTPVAFDTLTISNGGGRDNVATATLQVSASSFDELHLYATYGQQPSAPRVMMDDLSVTPVNSGNP